jgi:D-glycero-alpha-D-manno-heptose-7-phosphate kinase
VADFSSGPMVTARAWCRVDLAGGTLDIWPLGLFHPGARTVNLAIDLAATVRLRSRPNPFAPIDPVDPTRGGYRVLQGDSVVEAATVAELVAHPDGALAGIVAAVLNLPPFEVELESGSPRGGGLGGSSALVVALLAAAEEAFGLERSSPQAKVHLARDLEARLMGLPTGVQDHYPALLGGALEILHAPGGEQVRRLAADLPGLGASLLVVYSGQSHFSAGKNWQVVRRRLEGEAEITGLFSGLAEVAAESVLALESGDLPRLGSLLSREWSYRRCLAEGISTPVLEDLLAAALAAGAWGGKACGAGGGGCLALLCPPGRKAEVSERVERAGGVILAARPTAEPLSVVTTT